MNNRKDLSSKQKEILSFIEHHIKEHGYPPVVREIGEAVGLRSSATVHNHLCKLESYGIIKRNPTKPRAIEMLDKDSLPEPEAQMPMTLVPLVGQISAGVPIFASQHIEELYSLPSKLVGVDVFMLTVNGDSMINAGIYDGDFVLVRPQQTAKNGDIVVAMLNFDEATVKRFFIESDRIRLQPENDSYSPIYVKNPHIIGLVIGVIRLF